MTGKRVETARSQIAENGEMTCSDEFATTAISPWTLDVSWVDRRAPLTALARPARATTVAEIAGEQRRGRVPSPCCRQRVGVPFESQEDSSRRRRSLRRGARRRAGRSGRRTGARCRNSRGVQGGAGSDRRQEVVRAGACARTALSRARRARAHLLRRRPLGYPHRHAPWPGVDGLARAREGVGLRLGVRPLPRRPVHRQVGTELLEARRDRGGLPSGLPPGVAPA